MKSIKHYLLVIMFGLTIIPFLSLTMINHFFLSDDLGTHVKETNETYTAILSNHVEELNRLID